MTNVVAVMRSEKAADMLKKAAEGLDDTHIEIVVDSLENLAKNSRSMNGHDILLVDVSPINDANAELLRRFIVTHHHTRPVIVTSPTVNRDTIKRVLQTGAADILPQPIRQVDLVIAMDQAASRHEQIVRQADTPSNTKGRIVSFLKGGGGVGATTLAIQLGGLLARDKMLARDESAASRVCVLDFDIQCGAVGLYLDTETETNLSDLISAPDRLDQELLTGVMGRHESGLHLLQAPDELLPLDAIDVKFVTQLLDLARDSYDYVLVDLPHNWTEWTYATLNASDLMILVTQLTVGGVSQTARQMDAIEMNDLADTPIKLVLNRRSGGFMSDDADEVRDAEKALGRKFDFQLPNAYEITRNAINRGILIADVKRNTNLEKELLSMARALRTLLATVEPAMETSVAK